MCLEKKVVWLIPLIIVIQETFAKDDDYNILRTDGSYDFGYNNPDSYHYAQANRHNLVRGEFGGRDPKTGGIDTVHYTAGPRGYRPRGKNVVRKYDLRQSGPRPVGSSDDPNFDPYEDPSYSFSFRTRTYNRDENANRVGDVNGRYSYLDDVGERHNVEFVAGKNTGFHVKTPFPDSNPRAYGPLYFRGRGKPIPRGRTSVQRGLDGSYKFVSAGPDQRRTETSDATGHVRGSYTYLDDKGVQHSVHYIAGPETGYRVLKNVKGPHLPSVFPFQHPDIIPPDFYDEPEIFNAAASGDDRKPSGRPDFGDDEDEFNKSPKPRPRPRPRPGGNRFDNDSFGKKKPPQAAFGDEDDGYDTDFGDLFGGNRGGGGSKEEGQGGRGGGFKGGPSTPPSSGSTKPSVFNKPGGSEEDSFGISKEDSSGSSKEKDHFKPPKNGFYIPPEATKPFEMPKESSEEDYGLGHKKTKPTDYGDSYGRPSDSKPPKPKPPYGGRPGSSRPPVSSEEDENFGGLFGSESNRPRPPYLSGGGDEGGTSVITLGGPNRYCPKCEGAVLTNVGDTYLSVPPGVSVRAHVQAINLLPYSSRFPNPSEQLKAEVGLKTEQLNANKDTIVDKNVIESNDIDKMGGVASKTEHLKSSKEKVSTDDGTSKKTTTEIVPTTIRRII